MADLMPGTAADQSHDLLRRVFVGAGTVFLGSGFSRILLIIVEFSLATLLGPHGYGVYAIGFAVLGLVSTLALFGFGFGIVQYLSVSQESGSGDDRRSIARTSAIFTVVTASVIGAALFSAADLVAAAAFGESDLAPVLRLVALILPFETLNQCLSAIFRGLRKFRHHLLVLDILRNLALLVFLPFVTAHTPVAAIYVALGAGSAAGSVVGLWMLTREFDMLGGWKRDWEIFRAVFSFSYLLFIWQVIQKSANGMFVILMGMILPASAVGILAVVTRVASLLTFPQTVFAVTAPVEFARYNYLGDHDGLNRFFQIISCTLLVGCLLVGIPLAINADLVMKGFGHAYAPYGWALIALLTARVINVGSGPVGQLLIACRRRRTMFTLSSFELLLQAGVTVPAAMAFGLEGAIIAESGRQIVALLIRQVVLYRVQKIYAVTRDFLAISGIGIASVLVGAALGQPLDGLPKNVASTLGALVVLGTGITLVIRRNPELGGALVARMSRRARKARARDSQGPGRGGRKDLEPASMLDDGMGDG